MHATISIFNFKNFVIYNKVHKVEANSKVQKVRTSQQGKSVRSDSKIFYTLKFFWKFFSNGWKFSTKILHPYFMFISMQNDKNLFN